MHDSFDWWAMIIIPSIMGAATVGVGVVAVLVSRNASRLAHDIERMRVEDAAARDREIARARLNSMSTEEARTLRRWVHEERQREGGWGFVTRKLNEPPPPRTAKAQARIDAAVTLGQSLVPGAQELLRITEIDVEYAHAQPVRRGEATVLTSLEEQGDVWVRCLERIRRWGLDPEGEVPAVRADLHFAETDLDSYLGFPHDVFASMKD